MWKRFSARRIFHSKEEEALGTFRQPFKIDNFDGHQEILCKTLVVTFLIDNKQIVVC